MNFVDNLVKTVKKHSPEILVIGGVSGILVGTVLACKETRKIDHIIEEHKETLNEVHGKEVNENDYTEKDKRKDVAVVYAKTGVKLVRLYLPSIAIMSSSLVCILKSHDILVKRNTGLVAAYTGLSTVFEQYRKNIVEKFGEDADTEARYSIKATKIKGKKDEEDKIAYQETEETNSNEKDHSRFFDAASCCWDKSPNINLMTIHSAEVNLNRKLKTNRDHKISLSECLNALDLLPAEDGRVLGYEWRPGIDPTDENGVPQVIRIPIYVCNNKGKRVLKSVDEIISEGHDEAVMLLDFPNLKPIV